MKNKNISKEFQSLIVNTLKIITVALWLTVLFIAGINAQLIEAFLFTLALGVIAYFLFGEKNDSGKSKLKENFSSRQKFNSENYLSVFF